MFLDTMEAYCASISVVLQLNAVSVGELVDDTLLFVSVIDLLGRYQIWVFKREKQMLSRFAEI